MVGSGIRSVLVEFILHKFDELVDLAAQLDDDAANTTTSTRGSNSVVQLVTHCCGMLRRWSSTVNLGVEVPRDREAEFEVVMPVAEVLTLAAEARAAFLTDIERTDLDAAPVFLPPGWNDFWTASCAGVLLHVLEELCQHLGQAEITRDVVLSDEADDGANMASSSSS
ncbi:mycothiol transferase [Nesterenkonia natronophila]|uniref:DUF664 domain-containing protein n=1 Tax=Nesterenkonia natronophila TaxID=2174932 RepID=A0A3A4F267_9MICC|nr:DUF664 domain-containing protein [Nesterenkonia natronophila]RJN32153.1 DUF664 domain-containing protein [Nesterenkonia natronophila]